MYFCKGYGFALDKDYEDHQIAQHFWPNHDFSGCSEHEPELRRLRDSSRSLAGEPLISWMANDSLSLRLCNYQPGVDENGTRTAMQ